MKWFVGRFKYAFAGLRLALNDRSIRLQCIFGCIVLACSLFLSLSWIEWLFILFAIFGVVIAEIFNSCIERCVDYISMEMDPRAKAIKDLAAAGVFLMSCFAAIIGCMILLPKLFL